MKKIFLSFSFTLCIISGFFSQETEGHVVFSIELSSDNPQIQMAIPMFAGSTMEVFFTKNSSRTELNMGTFLNTTIITNTKKDKMLMLMNGVMGKIAVSETLSKMKEKAKKNNDRNPQDDNLESDEEENEYEIEFTNETKEIQGYICKKAILSNPDDGIELIYWYTEDIKFSKEGHNYFNQGIPGFPMEFETFNNEMKMKMVVTEYNKTLGKDASKLFDFTIPDGYKEMTLDEIESLGKGG